MLVGGWRMLSAVAILIAILTPGARVSAQDSKVAPAAQQGHSHSRRQTLDERVERLARYLNLSDGQRSVLKEILLEREQEILKLRHSASSGEELQMDRFRAVEDKTVERIHAILNDEQRKKYDPLGVRSQVTDAQRQGVDGWMKAMPK
jgi:hypothetical protein